MISKGAAVLAGLLAVGVPAARADEGAPGTGGTLRIAADPPRLELGRDDGCDLRISAPPDVDELTVTASAGKIEGVRRLPGAGFVARLRAPSEHVPRVAIVAALGRSARGLEEGWVAVPMSGRGTARVHGEPGAEVTLRVGDRTFGPALADAEGVAAVPVVVPPGIREAHQGFRPIDLRIPETPLVHAISERADVRADREERVRVFAYVVAPHGAARRGDALAFEPSRGTVGAAEREPGAWSATWTLPPGPAGEERLVVRLPSAAASRAVVRVAALAGPPAIVAVSFDRDLLVAGGDAATVTARALDAAGNRVPARLELAAQNGDLSDVTIPRPGEVVARLAAGTRLRGEEAVVGADAPDQGISGARAVALRPAAAADARFDALALVRGGATPVALRLSVADRFGNPVAETPEVTVERGKVLGVVARERGTFEVSYLAPAVDVPVRESVVARSGAAQATLAPTIAPPAPAVRLEATAGGMLALRGSASGASFLLAAERPEDLPAALRHGLETALRLEGGVVAGGSESFGTALAGISVRRGLSASTVLAVSAAAGGAFSGGDAGVAARAAASLALPLRRLEPFLELSVLGARPGTAAITTVGLAVGVRLGLEDRHDHDDPDRR